MDDLNKMFEEAIAKIGAKTPLDFAEGFGLISKTEAKQMKRKIRGCTFSGEDIINKVIEDAMRK